MKRHCTFTKTDTYESWEITLVSSRFLYFYTYFIQKVALLLFGVEPSRTLNGAFYFSLSNTVKQGK